MLIQSEAYGRKRPDSLSLTRLGVAGAGQRPRGKRSLGPGPGTAPHPPKSSSTGFPKNTKEGRGAASPPASQSATSLLAQAPPGSFAFALHATRLPARRRGLISALANQRLPRSQPDQSAAAWGVGAVAMAARRRSAR